MSGLDRTTQSIGHNSHKQNRFSLLKTHKNLFLFIYNILKQETRYVLFTKYWHYIHKHIISIASQTTSLCFEENYYIALDLGLLLGSECHKIANERSLRRALHIVLITYDLVCLGLDCQME